MTLQCFEDDPALKGHLWEEFAKAADTTPQELKKAYSRVVADGFYGPLPDEGCSMPFMDARSLLRKALQHTPAVTAIAACAWTCNGSHECNHPDHDEEDGPMCHDEEYEVEPETVKKEMFHGIVEIYGHLNL